MCLLRLLFRRNHSGYVAHARSPHGFLYQYPPRNTLPFFSIPFLFYGGALLKKKINWNVGTQRNCRVSFLIWGMFDSDRMPVSNNIPFFLLLKKLSNGPKKKSIFNRLLWAIKCDIGLISYKLNDSSPTHPATFSFISFPWFSFSFFFNILYLTLVSF